MAGNHMLIVGWQSVTIFGFRHCVKNTALWRRLAFLHTCICPVHSTVINQISRNKVWHDVVVYMAHSWYSQFGTVVRSIYLHNKVFSKYVHTFLFSLTYYSGCLDLWHYSSKGKVVSVWYAFSACCSSDPFIFSYIFHL